MENIEISPISPCFSTSWYKLVDFTTAKIEISILDDYSVELKWENCLVLVLLDAGIPVLLCNGTLCTAQSER